MAKDGDDHAFGSDDTELKLQLVQRYLEAFTQALRRKFKHLWYIDGFAGTGMRTINHPARPGDFMGQEDTPEWTEKRPRSARIALGISPAFDHLILMDRKPKHAAALEALKAENPDRSIQVICGDCNAAIRSAIAGSWSNRRAVLFLDPYGMEVEWETLKAIAATGAIDVWYLFSLEGLYRNAAHDINDVDPTKAAALTKMLGTDAWKDELYSKHQPDLGLFAGIIPDLPEETRRNADVKGLETYVTKRLKTIFPLVLDPYALPVLRPGPQRFSLYCMISNGDYRAMALARKIGDHILKAGK